MTSRKDLETEFLKISVLIAEIDLGARGTLMMEHVVLCKQAVLEVFDGPEIPVRDNNVALAQLMKANRELYELKKQILTLVPDEPQ